MSISNVNQTGTNLPTPPQEGSFVGRLGSNIISRIFTPELKKTAIKVAVLALAIFATVATTAVVGFFFGPVIGLLAGAGVGVRQL